MKAALFELLRAALCVALLDVLGPRTAIRRRRGRGWQAADHRLRRASGRCRVEGRRGGDSVGEAGASRKLVSVTNGDIGHWRMHGEALAKRRFAEVQAADKVLGVETEVLPIHDGELEPTLENRRTITRLIRAWHADIVICHRPWDYHPDHRYVGVLVQDAAYMVTVPFFCPDTPPLRQNPVFMYLSDNFQKPYPFRADVVVSLDDVFDQKLDAMHELESQLYEGGANGSEEFVAGVPGPRHRRPQGLAEKPFRAAVRRRGKPLSRRSGQVVRGGKRQGRQIRRGVRDLRIRPPAFDRGIGKAVSVCRKVASASSLRPWNR